MTHHTPADLDCGPSLWHVQGNVRWSSRRNIVPLLIIYKRFYYADIIKCEAKQIRISFSVSARVSFEIFLMLILFREQFITRNCVKRNKYGVCMVNGGCSGSYICRSRSVGPLGPVMLHIGGGRMLDNYFKEYQNMQKNKTRNNPSMLVFLTYFLVFNNAVLLYAQHVNWTRKQDDFTAPRAESLRRYSRISPPLI